MASHFKWLWDNGQIIVIKESFADIYYGYPFRTLFCY
jgi:hypothetical protein